MPMDVAQSREEYFAGFGVDAKVRENRVVSLQFRRGSAADLSLLYDAPDAREIDLTACTIIEEDLAILAIYTPRVEQLHLIATNLTDPGPERLRGLKKLRVLNVFANPRLTDAALEPLEDLPELAEVRVDGTAITPTGVTALQMKRPRLRVIGLTGSIGKPSQDWTPEEWDAARAMVGGEVQ